jgi:uncharacterized protein
MGTYFEWDPDKAVSNLRKHGISFELAAEVFADPLHIFEQDRIDGYEYHWRTMGMVRGFMLLVVAHSVRDENDDEIIRIISARAATPAERRRYEQ